MDPRDIDTRIIALGKEFFSEIAGEKPSLFDKGTWIGKVMDWSMGSEEFKTSMFRFVDVYPALVNGNMLTGHIREYFADLHDGHQLLAAGATIAGLFGSIGGSILHPVLSANIKEMAQQFILAEDIKAALKKLAVLRNDGFAAVVDVLGEATLSEEEATAYVNTYLELLQALQREQFRWHRLPGSGSDETMDWGCAPMVNIAVKPTALYCLTNPQDFEGSVTAILSRLRTVCQKVVEMHGFLCIDMESYRFKDIILEVYRRLKLKYRDYPHIGIVLQSYLRDTDRDLQDLLAWAEQHRLSIAIRLVKGAYWDYEVVKARQNNWEVPVWTIKAESDAAFERQAQVILEHHEICHFACASHNIRSVATVLELARELHVPEERYEFQVLYGMAEPVRKAILKVAGRVRLYAPYGSLVPGMGYLVRRLLENTANESFLRRSFAEATQLERLLENPLITAARAPAGSIGETRADQGHGVPPFANEPMVDFTRAEQRAAFPAELARVRARSGRTYPLFIAGREVTTDDLLASVNPNNPSEVLGLVCQAGIREIDAAVAAAGKAFPLWRDTDPHSRAAYLIKAAAVIRRQIFYLSALQVVEIGKQWDQAYADVGEAIDFLEYYAREMQRLGESRVLGQVPGETNHYFYEPRGVAAVIAPWNFPLAISVGMVSAAIVTGNCVVYKPSGLTSIIGWHLVDIFRECGLPAGVFNFVPGRSSIMGDHLVDHPGISLIAFTGSMEVGLRIVERAAIVHPGQMNVKRVICEMGGKNAVIVDDDADLDEAIPQILNSAFAFQGQKCSACSRVIVLGAIHDRFVARLVAMAKACRIGPAEDPGFFMGGVADDVAMKRIRKMIEEARRDGTVCFESSVPDGGYYVPMTIFSGIRPEHHLAREEVFGPVLAIMRVKDFDQALDWANGTSFALTGGLFSRSPGHIARARREFRVGNLYINRGITGAMVERQPFGGSRMSGVGSKAGGPDYLLQFMEPRVVTENTMRRGFTPHTTME
jgi:RHH-type proline utilization regulon transcriptional repressor/proline dehydrogenase/delta 1-pyrroline-5-carboxylate dehydrogenase